MKTFELPPIRVPSDMDTESMPDLLRYWYLGTKARRHMMLRRFSEVDAEVAGAGVERVLDIGSAWGYNVMALSLLGKRVIGMDLVADQFAVGKGIAKVNGLDFPVVAADAAWLPFPDEAFDAVTMVETFEHIYGPDRAAALSECRRVTRPGGRLVLSMPNHGSLVERLKRVLVRVPWARRRLPTMCYPTENVARGDYHPYRYHRPDPVARIAGQIESHGYNLLQIKYFLFVLKSASDRGFRAQAAIERLTEKIPVLRRLAATVCIVAERT
jgi:SAM-dependent methyltransferase